MRLIDADAMKTVEQIQKADFNSIETIRAWIESQPTIEERKTAKWAWVEEESGTVWSTGEPIFDAHFQCSECGFRPFENLEGDEVLTKYCPQCGARMENADEKEEKQ